MRISAFLTEIIFSQEQDSRWTIQCIYFLKGINKNFLNLISSLIHFLWCQRFDEKHSAGKVVWVKLEGFPRFFRVICERGSQWACDANLMIPQGGEKRNYHRRKNVKKTLKLWNMFIVIIIAESTVQKKFMSSSSQTQTYC